MSVTKISGASPLAPLKGQDSADNRNPTAAGARQTVDRVEISDAGKAALRNQQAAANQNAVPNDYYWTPHMLPGQKGYVPPPLSTQFDENGKYIKRGDTLDTEA